MCKRNIYLICMILFLVGLRAQSQSTFGNIVGNVVDPKGNVIPQSSITVTETQTNISRSTTTNQNGDYQILNLEPGKYTVSASKDGFDSLVKNNVVLEPRTSVRVDMKLTIGHVNSVVTVEASAPVINTESGVISEAQRGEEIKELPMNYRANSTSPFNAITTLPDVMVDSAGATGTASYSLAGNHPAQNEVSVDGFSVTSPRSSGVMVEVFPSTESVSEMRVTSQLAPAEYGQIGDISFQTKGGSNTFHGGVYEYLQNDFFDANSFLSTSKPKKRNNDFGGLISGPVILPHYNGRNKTFFFADYERNQLRGQDTIINSVPTADMRSGNLSAISTPIIDPTTGNPFPGNIIPSYRINQQAANILSLIYPLPTPGVVTPAGSILRNYRQNYASPSTTNLFDVRIDRNLTSRQLVWGKYTWKNQNEESPLSMAGKTGVEAYKNSPRIFGLSHTYTIRENLLNEARFGYFSQTTSYGYPNFPDGAKLISDIGLTNLGPLPAGSAIPDFYFAGSSSTSESPYGRQHRLHQRRFQISDNITVIKKRHTMKFGFDFRDIQSSDYVSYTGADDYGVYYFNDTFTNYDFADFLLGLPQKTEITHTGPYWDGHGRTYAYFAQDTFQLFSRLTLEFGLRYEYHPPIHDSTLQMANFLPSLGAVIVPNQKSLALSSPTFLQGINACQITTPNPPTYGNYPCTPVMIAADAKMPSSLRKSEKTEFLPRFSFAYRVTPKTVVRGGYGIYIEAMLGGLFYRTIGIHTSDDRTFVNADANKNPTFAFPNAQPGGLGKISPAGNNNFTIGTQPDLRDPYTQQWGLSVEQDLGRGTGVRVSYSGLHSVGLLVTEDYNQIHTQSTAYSPTQRPFPNWNKVRASMNAGSSTYHGMTVALSHRFTQGLYLQSSLAWSKNLSNAEGDAPNAGFVGETGSDVIDRFNISANRGNVSFTRRLRWLTTSNTALPFGRGQWIGKDVNRWVNGAIGGWHWTNIATLQSGSFMTPTYSGTVDISGTNAPNRSGSVRPDDVPMSNCGNGGKYKALAGHCYYYGWTGPIGRFGNASVGDITGPGTIIWNTGLAKEYKLVKLATLRIEGTSSNVLNHLNLGTPTLTVNKSNFGVTTSQRNSEGAGPRTFQLSARLSF